MVNLQYSALKEYLRATKKTAAKLIHLRPVQCFAGKIGLINGAAILILPRRCTPKELKIHGPGLGS